MTRVNSRPKNGGRNSQRVIDHGMSPANTQGATTKKKAEPRMAIVFCTAAPNTQAWLDHNSPAIVAQFILAIVAVRFLSSLAELRRCQDIDLRPGDLPTPPAF